VAEGRGTQLNRFGDAELSRKQGRRRRLRRKPSACRTPVARIAAGSAVGFGAAFAIAPAAQADVDQFVVNSAADPGDGTCDSTCTLRDAILAANDADSAFELDEVTFDSNLSGTITLAALLPDITDRVRITGPGATQLTVDAGTTGGVFTFTGTGGAVSYVDGLTLNGGATVVHAVESGNLVIKHSVVSGGSDAGVYADDVPHATRALVTIEDSTITGNATGLEGHGVSYFNTTRTHVDDNDVGVSLDGGAFGVQLGSVSGNSDGGIQVQNAGAGIDESLVADNHGTGAVSATATTGSSGVAFHGSTVTGNSSTGQGGAVSVDGYLHVYGSTITGNSSDYGGAVYLAGDSAGYIYFSTIYGNDATTSGGGIYLADGAYALLESATVSDNTAPAGSGGGIYGPYAASYVELDNTIVANSTGGDLAGDGSFHGNYSLIETPGSVVVTGSSDITGVDPALGALAANGGPTETQMPSISSPVLDAGYATPFYYGGPVFDQRHIGRPVDLPTIPNEPGGNASDIGAVELTLTEGPQAPPGGPAQTTPVGPSHSTKTSCKKAKKRATSAKRKCKKRRKKR
jgi:CSLREA domain-containing protein